MAAKGSGAALSDLCVMFPRPAGSLGWLIQTQSSIGD